MVRVLSIISLALAAVSTVSGFVVPRRSPPEGWQTDILESYKKYHERYLALDCQGKHGQDFFQQCCHPLLANETLSALPAQCTPNNCNDGGNNTSSIAPSLLPTEVTPTSTYVPPTSSVSPQPKHSSEPLESSSSTSSTPTPTPTPKPSPTPSPSPSPSPVSHPADVSGSGSGVNTGGQATFFYQGGVAGACGTVHSDSDFICAMDQARYGNAGNASPLCGKQVKITNTQNGNTVTVTVADDCPTCANSNSIDLSVHAFEALASLDEGVVPITWSFV